MIKTIDDSVKKLLTSESIFFNINDEDGREYDDYRKNRDGFSHKGDHFYKVRDAEVLIPKSENKKYYPDSIFKIDIDKLLSSLKYNVDSSSKRLYKTFIHTINKDIDIILVLSDYYSTYYSSPRTKRCVDIGIRYHGLTINYYSFTEKTDPSGYIKKELDIYGIYDLDFYNLIDINNFKEVSYIDNYKLCEFWTFNCFQNADWYGVFKTCVENKTFNLTESFGEPLPKSGFSSSNVKYPKDLFIKLGVEKLIISTPLNGFDFDLPEKLSVEFNISLDSRDYVNESIKDKELRTIQNCPNLRPYLPESYKNDSDRITFLQKEWELYNTKIKLSFKYMNLEGFVVTNDYEYRYFKEYYDKCDTYKFDVAGLTLKINRDDFYNCIKREVIAKRKKLDTVIEYFKSDKIGYTSWWSKDFNKIPEKI